MNLVQALLRGGDHYEVCDPRSIVIQGAMCRRRVSLKFINQANSKLIKVYQVTG